VLANGFPDMKNPKLDPANVARWLQNLSDHQFIAFFAKHLSERHIYRAERRHQDSHLVLANAKRDREDNGTTGPWQLQVLCAAPQQNWGDDAPVCQFGTHCGHETASVSKNSQCPICGGEASGS
jgi:hypothetical protein